MLQSFVFHMQEEIYLYNIVLLHIARRCERIHDSAREHDVIDAQYWAKENIIAITTRLTILPAHTDQESGQSELITRL